MLAVDLSILDAGGAVVHTWTLSDPSDVIGVTVGGNRYGWFAQNDFSFLAFDNSRLSVAVGPPTSADQCKKGGWEQFNTPRTFKNQGDCVSFVQNGKSGSSVQPDRSRGPAARWALSPFLSGFRPCRARRTPSRSA